MKPTEAEINFLKERWLADPVWDIWLEPGFESVGDELYVFQKEQEAEGYGALDFSVVDPCGSLMARLKRSSREEVLARKLYS